MSPTNVLLTGASGGIGGALLPRLLREGHAVRAFGRSAARAPRGVPFAEGDAETGRGLDAALDGVDVAYYLIHSMDPDPDFARRELGAAEAFVAAARAAGTQRVVYLGGPVPSGGVRASEHLASRVAVERVLLTGLPGSVALRASIAIGARSRSFRFLVRLVERLPVVPLPAWRRYRTRPVDIRDVVELLARAATAPEAAGRSLDAAGPELVSYEELIDRIREALLLDRAPLRLPFDLTPVASVVAAAVAGEEPGFIGPLMGSLAGDLEGRGPAYDGAALLGVRTHRLDAAIERALREWEEREPLRAR